MAITQHTTDLIQDLIERHRVTAHHSPATSEKIRCIHAMALLRRVRTRPDHMAHLDLCALLEQLQQDLDEVPASEPISWQPAASSGDGLSVLIRSARAAVVEIPPFRSQQ